MKPDLDQERLEALRHIDDLDLNIQVKIHRVPVEDRIARIRAVKAQIKRREDLAALPEHVVSAIEAAEAAAEEWRAAASCLVAASDSQMQTPDRKQEAGNAAGSEEQGVGEVASDKRSVGSAALSCATTRLPESPSSTGPSFTIPPGPDSSRRSPLRPQLFRRASTHDKVSRTHVKAVTDGRGWPRERERAHVPAFWAKMEQMKVDVERRLVACSARRRSKSPPDRLSSVRTMSELRT